GQPELVPTTNDLFKAPVDWTREGLLVASINERTGRDIWMVPTGGERKPVPWLQSAFSEYRGRVSPDGRWCAYLSNEAGKDDVYIQSFPVPGHKVRVSTNGAGRIGWMPKGDGLCFRNGSGGAGGTEILCAAVTN